VKKINKKILISIFIFLIIILISISIIIANNTSNNSFEVNKEKIYYQIKYLDAEIIDMSTLLNNNINWQELQNRTKRLYNYWNSTILDLNILDIDKNNLTNFGKILDYLTISINNQNGRDVLNNLLELYNKLTIYNKSLNYDEEYKNILLAKYNLLVSYSIVEDGNWTLVHESIIKCSNYISNIGNSIDNNKYNQYNINQAYIAVKELENLINIKNLELFYIKYSIAIEKLQNI